MNNFSEFELHELLAQARKGSNNALTQLLQTYRSYLALLARLNIDQKLQAKVDASDLVQETFCQAHQDFPRFCGTTEKQLLSWLRSILASTTADFVRRYYGTQKRDLRLERQLQDQFDQSSETVARALAARDSSPSQRAARREEAALLADALSHLPEDYREVIILHHLQGRTMEEVAQRMDRSLGSVHKLWARALVSLRKQMRGYE